MTVAIRTPHIALTTMPATTLAPTLSAAEAALHALCARPDRPSEDELAAAVVVLRAEAETEGARQARIGQCHREAWSYAVGAKDGHVQAVDGMQRLLLSLMTEPAATPEADAERTRLREAITAVTPFDVLLQIPEPF